MKTAIVYARVSTQSQEDRTSLHSQTESCLEYAAAHGYEVVASYRETFTRADLFERPILSQIREQIRSKKINALICFSIDRLSGDVGHLAVIDYECKKANVAMLFATEEYENTPQGKLLQSVNGYVAETERQKIIERTVRGKVAIAKSKRLHNAGIEKYGYRRDKEKRVRIIYEPEAVIIRQIFQWAYDGWGAQRIAKELNRRGIPSPGSGKIQYDGPTHWYKSIVRRFLSYPDYAGQPTGLKYQVRNPLGAMALHPETSPAIIDLAVFQKVNQTKNTGAVTRNETTPILLRGMVFCSLCGASRSPSIDNRKGKSALYYRCNSRHKGGTCGAKMIRGEALDAWVWGLVQGWSRNPHALIETIQEKKREVPDKSADLETVNQRLLQINKEQERILRSLRQTDNELVISVFESELEKISLEKKKLVGEHEKISQRIAYGQEISLGLDTVSGFLARLESNDNPSFAEKRLILEALSLTVSGEGNRWQLLTKSLIEAGERDTTFY